MWLGFDGLTPESFPLDAGQVMARMSGGKVVASNIAEPHLGSALVSEIAYTHGNADMQPGSRIGFALDLAGVLFIGEQCSEQHAASRRPDEWVAYPKQLMWRSLAPGSAGSLSPTALPAAARDARAIVQRGVFRLVETWLDQHSRRFNPGNYYYVGGNSKFYDAVLIGHRERDFPCAR